MPRSRPVTDPPRAPAHVPIARQAHVFFEYVGRSGMTVIGGATGKRYRFDRPGTRVAVDWTDRPSLAAIPNLRLAAGPR
jgi:hypothetical protein